MANNTPGEIRAAVMQIEEQGGLPTGLLQALYEHNTGYRNQQTALPKHRQNGQNKETEIVDAGLRLQEKMGEFGNNKVLGTHAFMYGDKRTSAALQNGFSQDEIDNTLAVLARVGKYGGEPLSNDGLLALSNSIGVPSRDLNPVAKAPPPKPVVPTVQGTEGIEDSGFADVPPYAVVEGRNIINVESHSNDSFGDGNPENDGIQRVMYDDRSWNVYKNGQLIETIPPQNSQEVVAEPSKQVAVNPSAGISSLRSAIFGGESGGNYNIVNRGKRHGYSAGQVDLTNKTIDQVLAEQTRGDYKAAGAYQIIPGTLRAAKKAMGLSGNERFTPQLQDRIFADYLAKTKRPPLRDYIIGKSNNIKAAHTALAQEWASVDRGDGLSYYHGDGVNKAHIPLQKSMNAVQDMRNQYQANIQSGMSEDEAYRQALIGGGTAQSLSSDTAAQSGSLMGSLGFSNAPSQTAETVIPNDTPTQQTDNTAKAITQRQFTETPQTNWQEIAKKAFDTKRERYVPKYVSQAVRGAIKGV